MVRVGDLDQYPTPERFRVEFDSATDTYTATPEDGPWADGSIPGAEAIMAIGDSPEEAIANAHMMIEHIKAQAVTPPASYEELMAGTVIDLDELKGRDRL